MMLAFVCRVSLRYVRYGRDIINQQQLLLVVCATSYRTTYKYVLYRTVVRYVMMMMMMGWDVVMRWDYFVMML